MEHPLSCNVMSCRQELREQALVTTCSHIFCVNCASKTVLTSPAPEHRSCPACGTRLPKPDDAVITNLSPSEDYKTSILSGLSPDTIMECAGRALSFWSYQVSQDLIWEAHRCKALTARCQDMSKEVDRVVNEANTHLVDAQNKMQNMATDQDELRKKNEELSQAYKEKSRKLLNTQELYDKLKRRLMLGQIQDAASDAVDATMNGGLGQVSYRNDNVESQAPFEQQFGTPMTGHRYSDRLNQPAGMPAHLRMGPPDIRSTTWARPAYPQAEIPSTPATHRQRPGADPVGLSAIPGFVAGTPMALAGNGRMRHPLRENQPYQRANLDSFSGAGLSSRLKTGQAPAASGSFVSAAGPQVARRSG